MKRNPYYTGPVSDHFDGLRFYNPDTHRDRPSERGLNDFLKWRFAGTKAKWPASVPVTPAKPLARVDDLTITMVGHATLLIQIGGVNLLTDPVWSDRASPLGFAGPKRSAAPGIAFADLPRIDAVLLTHNHYDHLDIATIARLHQAHAPEIIAPLGNDRVIHSALPGVPVRIGDWGDSLRHGPLTVHFEPCHHWSARGLRDRSMALWSSFVIEGKPGKVLHVGDTGFDEGKPYRHIPERHGQLRAAILPMGAYEPRWYMQGKHQNPEEATQGFELCGAAFGIGHHWGTFQLTDEARHKPLDDLAIALDSRNIPAERFRALNPGEAWAIPKH